MYKYLKTKERKMEKNNFTGPIWDFVRETLTDEQFNFFQNKIHDSTIHKERDLSKIKSCKIVSQKEHDKFIWFANFFSNKTINKEDDILEFLGCIIDNGYVFEVFTMLNTPYMICRRDLMEEKIKEESIV